MKIRHQDGLLFISLSITYKGKTRTIENVVIDTGATHSIISIDAVSDWGISMERGDKIVTSIGIGGKQYAFVKRVDGVEFNGFKLGSCEVDFGLIDLQGSINGLLGLDLLLKAGAVIDLKNLLLYEGV
ncbi:retropepsin-like aspartic protease [Desulfotomaculum nigrificans]|uniref:retropepsin-like aspartic protease n=1 Tax=Desulfotomaculum nigrificans TaxID=1565 RepID=UPI0001FAE68A|nr:retropepsin-like aspartic protease [Desulfotomaculum nigrificans]